MSLQSNACIYACLPSGISQSALTALSTALGLKLQLLDKSQFKPSSEFGAKLKEMALANPQNTFVLDLGQLAKHGLNLTGLKEQLEAPALRNRIFLCHSEGQVSIGIRNMAKSLGFAELVADFDPRDSLGGLKSLSEWICQQVPGTRERLNRLPAFLKTVSFGSASEAPRALVQRLTGHCAELLAGDLVNHIQVQNRSYHLKSYPECMLANEVCQYLQGKFRLLESQAVLVGKALQALGFIYHVAHEKIFANEGLFFRFAYSKAVDKLPTLEVWNTLRTDLAIKDRSYLGKDYPQSFVGSEAIDMVASRWSLSRTDAWIVMHRFEQLGLLSHVTQDHGMVDGNFYYRLH